MDKKSLAIILSKLKEPKSPKPSLEQYTIPGDLAAEILNLAYLHGDIKDKDVFDFGTGSGRLAIGASLLGAKSVVGIDIDKVVLKTAVENKREIGLERENLFFVCCDIEKWNSKADTILQNPPFGIQTIHADRVFLKKALECGEKIYSLHRGGYKKTREFLIKFVEENGGFVRNVIKFKFALPYTFKFHKKPIVRYDVDLYVIERIN
ncbi:MAG: METTL5 family protein [Candidatus Aenigmatarchaeota archaeon]